MIKKTKEDFLKDYSKKGIPLLNKKFTIEYHKNYGKENNDIDKNVFLNENKKEEMLNKNLNFEFENFKDKNSNKFQNHKKLEKSHSKDKREEIEDNSMQNNKCCEKMMKKDISNFENSYLPIFLSQRVKFFILTIIFHKLNR